MKKGMCLIYRKLERGRFPQPRWISRRLGTGRKHGGEVLRDCNVGSHDPGADYTGVFILGDSGGLSHTPEQTNEGRVQKADVLAYLIVFIDQKEFEVET